MSVKENPILLKFGVCSKTHMVNKFGKVLPRRPLLFSPVQGVGIPWRAIIAQGYREPRRIVLKDRAIIADGKACIAAKKARAAADLKRFQRKGFTSNVE